MRERYSDVADAELEVPIDNPSAMGPALYTMALEAGFDLRENEDSSTAKGCAGGAALRYEGTRNGMARYTVYRRLGRGEVA